MTKFKTGDVVRIIGDKAEHGYANGHIAIITMVDEFDPLCTYELDDGSWAHVSDIELVTDTPHDSNKSPKLELNIDLGRLAADVEAGQVRSDGQGCAILVINPLSSLEDGDFNAVVLADPYTDGEITFSINSSIRNQTASEIAEEFPILLDVKLAAEVA